MLNFGMCLYCWMWIDVWGGIFPVNCCLSQHTIKLIWNKWAHRRLQCLVLSCRNELWQAVNSSSRYKTRIPCLQTALFTFYWDTDGGFVSGIHVTQDTIRRMWHSFNTGNLIQELLLRFLGSTSSRLHTCLHSAKIQFTPTAVKSMLSRYHVTHTDCVKRNGSKTARTSRLTNYN